MIKEGQIAELLSGPDDAVLDQLPRLLPDLGASELFDLLALLEDAEMFRDRLPLRLKLYARIAESAAQPELKLIALLRLLRRLGSRKDLPDLGKIPERLHDFADYLAMRATELMGETALAEAAGALAMATRASRAGDVNEMTTQTDRGIAALDEIAVWTDPPEAAGLEDLAVAETGHELMSIAANAAYRSGDVARARELAESWAGAIDRWENLIGPLTRQRYQYYQLVGHLDCEVGLSDAALDAYSKALEYAPTPYRSAFLWLSMAQVERELGRADESRRHAAAAIDAWLQSPYPQTAAPWIEWLAAKADSPDKRREVEIFRERAIRAGGIETNRVVRAMTELYRVHSELRDGADPAGLASPLDKLIDEMNAAGSWPNMIALLVTRAVVAGRLEDREGMDEAIQRARHLIDEKLAPEARPPSEFFLESAHALALRDVGAYEEAFRALFERALEARKKYPGGVGPEEQTALEAVYYLGALAGHDPDTIEKRIRATLVTAG